MEFNTPEVTVNPDGWGPTAPPSQFQGLPYAPFSRAEKLWRPADFAAPFYKGARRERAHAHAHARAALMCMCMCWVHHVALLRRPPP